MDNDAKCPFCRVPMPRLDKEMIERIKKRVEMDDANAIYRSRICYYGNVVCRKTGGTRH